MEPRVEAEKGSGLLQALHDVGHQTQGPDQDEKEGNGHEEGVIAIIIDRTEDPGGPDGRQDTLLPRRDPS
jgi:hypothetical protein